MEKNLCSIVFYPHLIDQPMVLQFALNFFSLLCQTCKIFCFTKSAKQACKSMS